MLCSLILPTILGTMAEAIVECVYARPEASMKPGDKLLDLSIDLSGAFLQNCPPISYYRLIVRERAILRRMIAAQGEAHAPGDCLAVFSTEPGEADDGPIGRPVRITTAGILSHPAMWSTQAR
jgi:hypothetical protein